MRQSITARCGTDRGIGGTEGGIDFFLMQKHPIMLEQGDAEGQSTSLGGRKTPMILHPVSNSLQLSCLVSRCPASRSNSPIMSSLRSAISRKNLVITGSRTGTMTLSAWAARIRTETAVSARRAMRACMVRMPPISPVYSRASTAASLTYFGVEGQPRRGSVLGLRVRGLYLRVWGEGSGVWDGGLGAKGVGFGIEGLGLRLRGWFTASTRGSSPRQDGVHNLVNGRKGFEFRVWVSQIRPDHMT